MPDNIAQDERELKELILALFYAQELNHGTAGHNRLSLLAKLASERGLKLNISYELIDRGQIIAKSEEGLL